MRREGALYADLLPLVLGRRLLSQQAADAKANAPQNSAVLAIKISQIRPK